MLNLDDLTYKIRLDDSELPRAAARTDAAMRQLGGAAAANQAQFSGVARSAKLTRQEMLTLNYTMNDVAASLASGASPMTILLQQGGQVTQAFGGLGATFSKLASFITPVVAGIGAVATVVGTLALAYRGGSAESEAFEKGMARSGNVAGITETQFRSLAGQISVQRGVTIGFAKDVLQALVETGQFGPAALKEVGTAAAAMGKAFDMSADDVAKDFAKMGASVAHWAADHNKTMNFLTIEQYRYIRALEEQGRVTEAQVYTAKLVESASERVRDRLGYLQTAWKGVKDWASKAWDAMLNVGRTETTQDQIDRVRQKLEERMARGPLNDLTRGSFDKGNEALRQELYLLQEKQRFESRSLELQSAAALANRKAIEDERKKEGKKDKPGGAARDPRDYFNDAQDKLEERLRQGLDRYVESELAAQARLVQKRQEDYARRVQEGADIGQQLAAQTASLNASMIADDEARARAQLDIERQAADDRIIALGLIPEQEARLRGRAAEYYLARERQLTEELKPEYQRRLELVLDFNRYMKKAGDEFRDGFIQSGREAFSQWVATGKVSASTITDFIRRKFSELVYDQYLASLFDSLGKSIFGIFGGGSFGVTSSGSWFGDVMASVGIKGMAGGGGVGAYSLHRVNEQGPELLTVRGRDYLMMGGSAGTVTPSHKVAQRLGGGATHITIAPVFHGGVNRNELMSGMAVAADLAVATVRDQRRRGDRSLVEG